MISQSVRNFAGPAGQGGNPNIGPVVLRDQILFQIGRILTLLNDPSKGYAWLSALDPTVDNTAATNTPEGSQVPLKVDLRSLLSIFCTLLVLIEIYGLFRFEGEFQSIGDL